jgi:hypothetical protein
MVVNMVGKREDQAMKRLLEEARPLMADCRTSGAEIEYPPVDRETPAACSNCGEPVELVIVIEDSTANGLALRRLRGSLGSIAEGGRSRM